MTIDSLAIKLSFEEASEAVAACIAANRVAFLLGSPGIAKTTLAKVLAQAYAQAKQIDYPCLTMILSNYEATDIAGLPVTVPRTDGRGKVVERVPFLQIRRACENPGLLFLDELTTVEKSVEGPAMRLALERYAGDDVQLHEETRIVAAGNYPNETPRGQSLTAAMTNRLVMLPMEPSHAEVVTFFRHGPGAANEAAVRRALVVFEANKTQLDKVRQIDFADFAATALVQDLVQMTPPEASLNDGMPWASPRAWEIGLSAYSALRRLPSSGKIDRVGLAILSGTVGPHMATAFLQTRELRSQLPSIEEIVENPAHAKLPTKREYAIAMIGLLPRVADIDYGAACIYMIRLQDEILAAALTVMLRKPTEVRDGLHKQSRHKGKAVEAYINAWAHMQRLQTGQVKMKTQAATLMLEKAAETMAEGIREVEQMDPDAFRKARKATA